MKRLLVGFLACVMFISALLPLQPLLVNAEETAEDTQVVDGLLAESPELEEKQAELPVQPLVDDVTEGAPSPETSASIPPPPFLSPLPDFSPLRATPGQSQAKENDTFTFDISHDGSATLTGLASNAVLENDQLTIPDVIQDPDDANIWYPVASIAPQAFFMRKLAAIKFATDVNGLPSSNLKEIGEFAFAENQLTNLPPLPASLEIIASSAFKGNRLSSLDLSNTKLIHIGVNAFQMNQLTDLFLGDSLAAIGDGAFSYNMLTQVHVPDGVTDYGYGVFAHNNRYVQVETQNELVRTEKINEEGGFGQVVNPVEITVHFVDSETGEPILGDQTIGLDFTDPNGIILIGQENTYVPPKITGFQAVEDEIRYIPDSPQYELTVKYNNEKILPTIELVKAANLAEGTIVSKEVLLAFVKATDFKGIDISDRISVDPETFSTTNNIPSQEVTYTVTDDYGNTAVKRITFLIGQDWSSFPLGNDWVLGDFTYDPDAPNKLTGFSESGLAKVADHKDLILPHINPNDGKTVIDTIADSAYASFGNQGLTSVRDYMSPDASGSGNIRFIEPYTNINTSTTPPGVFNHNALKSIGFNALEQAGDKAFNGNNLSSLYLPKLKQTYYCTFADNQLTELDENTLPKLEVAGTGTFLDNNLSLVHLPFLKVAGEAAFIVISGDNNLSDVDLPSLEIAGPNAFKGCKISEVTSVHFPRLHTLETGAFANNPLTLIDIPSLVVLNGQAFEGVKGLDADGNSIVQDNFKNLEWIGVRGLRSLGITSLTIPKLKSIDYAAFLDNPGDPDYENKVVIWADIDLPSRENYIVNPGGTPDGDWNEDDFAWDPDESSRLLGLTEVGKQKLALKNAELVLPDRAEIVGPSAFENIQLTSVIGRRVRVVEDSGFWNSGLKGDLKDSFPELEKTDQYAFGYNNLTSLHLDKLQTAGFWSFINNQLTDLDLPELLTVGDDAFSMSPGSSDSDFNKIASLRAPKLRTIGKRAFRNHQLTSLDLPSVEEIGVSAFANVFKSSANAYRYDYPDGKITGYEDKTLQTVNLPRVNIIHDLAFAGNAITDAFMPQVQVIARRAFDRNKLKEDLYLKQIQTIGNRAFGSCSLDNVYVGEDSETLTDLAPDAFYRNFNNNQRKGPVYIFTPGRSNTNKLQDGKDSNGNVLHIINPTKVTVRYIIKDADGNEIPQDQYPEGWPESWSEYIYGQAGKDYQAVNVFSYQVEQTPLHVDDNRQENTVDFIYTKFDVENTEGIELRQQNEYDRNTGIEKMRYLIGERMATNLYLDLTGNDTDYDKGILRLYYDPKYIDENSITLPLSSLVKGFKAENGRLEISVGGDQHLQGGTQLQIPIFWKFRPYVTPDNYEMQLNAEFAHDFGDGGGPKVLAKADSLRLEGYYNKPHMVVTSPLNLPNYNYGSAQSDADGPRWAGAFEVYKNPADGTAAYRIDPDQLKPVRFDLRSSELSRYVNQAELKVQLPYYTKVLPDGSEEVVPAVFDPTENPDWSKVIEAAEDGTERTVFVQTQSFPKTTYPGQYFQPIYFRYPEWKSGSNSVVHASLQLTPDEQGPKEEVMVSEDDISIYTALYENVLSSGDPRFEKLPTGYPRGDNSYTYFIDNQEDRGKVISYLLRLSSLASKTDLRELTVTDYGLDKRLYYYGVSFPRDDHTASHLQVTIKAFSQSGEKINPGVDVQLFESTVTMAAGQEVIFPADSAQDIDYIQFVLPANHCLFSAIEIHVDTKLRDPNAPVYNAGGLATSNVFVNHAVLTGNLYQKGTDNPASERGDQVHKDSGIVISKYDPAWDNLPGNFVWGSQSEVYVVNYKERLGLSKTQTYPSTRERIVYPGEEGNYTLSLTPEIQLENGRLTYDRALFREKLFQFQLIDLLPRGVLPTEVQLSPEFQRSGGSWKLVENYENSGRQALIFTTDTGTLNAGVFYIATVKTSVEALAKDGDVTNEAFVYFTSENDKVTKVGNFEAPIGHENEEGWLKASTTFKLAKVKEIFARKYIRRAEDLAWLPTGVMTESEGLFDYRLNLTNSLETARTKVEIVDVLPYLGDVEIQEENIGTGLRAPRQTEFENTFDVNRWGKGIFTAPAGYTVEFWNSDNPIDYAGQSAEKTLDQLTWSSAPAENTRAIRVKAQEGVKLTANSSVDIYIPMKAPANDITNDYALTGKRAWNSYVHRNNATIRFLEPNKVYNELAAPHGSISFTKFGQDELGWQEGANPEKKPLVGASFEARQLKMLDDGKGGQTEEIVKIYQAVSDENGRVIFEDLPIQAIYEIVELEAPDGYQLLKDSEGKSGSIRVSYDDFKKGYNAKTDSFHVAISDADSQAQFLNIKPVTGSLTIQKTNSAGQVLPYVQFKLLGKSPHNNKFVSLKRTDVDGNVAWSDLIEGEYELSEILPEGNTGYIPIKPITFVIDKDHKNHEWTGEKALVNETVRVVINKLGVGSDFDLTQNLGGISSWGKDLLDGYSFQIQEIDQDGQAVGEPLTTEPTKKGTITLEGLKINTLYQIKELKPDNDARSIYLWNDHAYTFMINGAGKLCDANGKEFTYNALNIPNPEKPILGRVEVTKVDDRNQALEGAVFALYRLNETEALKTVSSSLVEGTAKAVFDDLEPGDYCLKELSAPAGYHHSLKEYTFTIPRQISQDRLDKDLEKGNIVIHQNAEGIADKIFYLFSQTYSNQAFDIQVIKGDTRFYNVTEDMADELLAQNPSAVKREKGSGRFDIYLPLSGVGFELFEIDAANKKVSKGSLTSGEDGSLDFSQISDFSFKENCRYELIETKALSGYRLDQTPIVLSLPDEAKKEGFDGTIVRYKNNVPERGRILISKYDEDTRTVLAGAVFSIEKDGEPDKVIKKATSGADGMIEFRDLELGFTYRIREVFAPEGYQLLSEDKVVTLTQEESSASFVFFNPQWVQFEIEKKWVGQAKDEAVVHVLADGQTAIDKDGNPIPELHLNRGNNWKVKVENLPKYNPENHQLIKYSIAEDLDEGYQSLITGSSDYLVRKFTVTNTDQNRKSIGVTKLWVGKALDQVTVRLLVDGVPLGQTVVLSAANNWQYVFEDLAVMDGDREIHYSVEEKVPEGYKMTMTGSADEGFVITNTEEPENPPETPPGTPPGTPPENPPETPPEKYDHSLPKADRSITTLPYTGESGVMAQEAVLLMLVALALLIWRKNLKH
ncbi:MAG: SpaA isopeptide-forming pilin-related protein [Eubacteriales bacterium]|nr:SpaA isopeptide-forming pilin-related protein [Clostridiales bacterium]MDY5835628.1 SpaA isopeptide-forming pilin-related protein [Eubacteriales bacterium]